MADRWEEVAAYLEGLACAPTDRQLYIARKLDIELADDLPAPVAAVVMRSELSDALFETLGGKRDELPPRLQQLEDDLGLTVRGCLRTASGDEVSAWFESRYMLKTAQGLRSLKPAVGDVVARRDEPKSHMVISSIGKNGCIYMKGGRGQRSWPNHLIMIARPGIDDQGEELAKQVDAEYRNHMRRYTPSSPEYARLDEYLVESKTARPEAIRELDDLLGSGEGYERPYQELIERHPELLASLVTGNWGTYVIPQQRLGAEHVPDFLVLGVNSLGPQWVAVEIEAPRHALLTAAHELTGPVRHALTQVQEWRNWLTWNVAYAQDSLHLHGLTNHVPGLVLIGRDSPIVDRQLARARTLEQNQVRIQSWDWLVRQARGLVDRNGMQAFTSLFDQDGSFEV